MLIVPMSVEQPKALLHVIFHNIKPSLVSRVTIKVRRLRWAELFIRSLKHSLSDLLWHSIFQVIKSLAISSMADLVLMPEAFLNNLEACWKIH